MKTCSCSTGIENGYQLLNRFELCSCRRHIALRLLVTQEEKAHTRFLQETFSGQACPMISAVLSEIVMSAAGLSHGEMDYKDSSNRYHYPIASGRKFPWILSKGYQKATAAPI